MPLSAHADVHRRRGQWCVPAGHGERFAPAGRAFREWVAVTVPDRRRWQGLLAEARYHAAGPDRRHDRAKDRRRRAT